jgi:hypothetical protein
MQKKIENILMWICVLHMLALPVALVHDFMKVHKHFHSINT